ncbi:MAG: hypothetical protein HYX39_07195 [Bacteroidetes bacterium]|nr:hypothetical protein [Bacteroidota bacterium]
MKNSNWKTYLNPLSWFQIGRGVLFGVFLLLFSLGVGMIGFKHYIGKSWADAFINSAMLLTGMGPVDEPETDGGKIFAGIFSLYSGIIFLSIVGLMMVPIFHKYMHKLNMESEDKKKQCGD